MTPDKPMIMESWKHALDALVIMLPRKQKGCGGKQKNCHAVSKGHGNVKRLEIEINWKVREKRGKYFPYNAMSIQTMIFVMEYSMPYYCL